MTHRTRHLRRVAAPAALLAPLLLTACTFGTLVHEAVHGPPATPALFTLPDRATLVLVDADTGPATAAGPGAGTLDDPALPHRVAAVARHHLRFHRAPATAVLVDDAAVTRLEARLGDRWSATPITEIGRRLKADQVIYARLAGADRTDALRDDGHVAALRLRVKVLDVATGDRLWPPAAAGLGHRTADHTLNVVATVEQRRRRLEGKATAGDTHRALADDAGRALAQLFYDWTPPPPGERL